MVSNATIRRFADQIDALEAKLKAKRGPTVVFVTGGSGETRDAAWERHLKERPEDAGADVVIYTFYDDEIPGDEQRARELAAAKRERLRVVGQGPSIGLVPRKAASAAEWSAKWGAIKND